MTSDWVEGNTWTNHTDLPIETPGTKVQIMMIIHAGNPCVQV